jgi:dienelactone hydrolase
LGAIRTDRISRVAALAALPAVLAACGGGGGNGTTTTTTTTPTTTSAVAPTPAGPPRLTFSSGTGKPLGYVNGGVVGQKKGIRVSDVSYLSRGRRVPAYLVEETGARDRPGVILVHGSGGDRSQLLSDAVSLARHGVVALTITEPSSSYPPPTPTTADQLLSESVSTVVEDVVAVRRAADLLQSLAAVDPKQIGYLGWSAGAKTGAFVAASDPRFKAFALLSGGAAPVSAFVAQVPEADRAHVRNVLGSVDPLRYLSFARKGTVLLEDGTKDKVVPHSALANFIHAAPAGTVVRWYPAGHTLSPKAFQAAFAWLAQKLA